MARKLALIMALAGLALPTTASAAETFCVHSPANCLGTPKPSLQAALDAADANAPNTKDTIRLGIGLFNDGRRLTWPATRSTSSARRPTRRPSPRRPSRADWSSSTSRNRARPSDGGPRHEIRVPGPFDSNFQEVALAAAGSGTTTL